MTANLWIFGDSYGCDMPNHPSRRKPSPRSAEDLTLPVWTDILCRELGMMYNNFSLSGASPEYVQLIWHQHRQNFNSGDIVVLILTEPKRTWIDHDRPSYTDPAEWIDLIDPDCLSKMINLMDPKIKAQGMSNWLAHAILHAQHHGYRLIVAAAFLESYLVLQDFFHGFDQTTFDHCVWVDAWLYEISRLEISEPWRSNNRFLTGGDVRNGHLTFTNHRILANIILEALKSGKNRIEVDILREFVTDIIHPQNLRDPDFVTRELGSWADQMRIDSLIHWVQRPKRFR